MTWTRPRTCGSGHCLEISHETGMVLLRNSQAPNVEILATEPEWTAFLTAAKNGEFDTPAWEDTPQPLPTRTPFGTNCPLNQ